MCTFLLHTYIHIVIIVHIFECSLCPRHNDVDSLFSAHNNHMDPILTVKKQAQRGEEVTYPGHTAAKQS